MTDVKYGSSSAGFQDAIARMQAQENAIVNQEKGTRRLADAEKASSTATKSNIGARGEATAAIEAQTGALESLSSVLGRETTLLNANTLAWQRSATARREALGTTAAGAASGVGKAEVAQGERYAATSVGSIALPQLAAADAAAATSVRNAAAKYLESRGVVGLGTRQGPSAIEQAAAQVAAAQPLSANAAAVRRAAEANANPVLPQDRIKGPGTYLGETGAVRLGAQASSAPFVVGGSGIAEATALRTASLEGGTVAIGKYTAAEQEMIAVNNEVVGSLARVGEAQVAANASVQLAAGEYAASSTALQRHGALSTEFIQGLARGEVTLAEFGSALTATIGKFAGWAVAGGLVYGAYEALKRITEGATHTATGVAQLERSIPGLNKTEAEAGFRSVGARTNVPIAQVAEAQFYAARAGFHSQPESLKAGETALLAEKLDQVPVQDAAKSLGALHVAFNLNADAIRQVFNELDVGQLKFNARLNQTLPQMGRASSAFANAGGTAQELARQLVQVTGATGGGGGQGGGNPATLFIREATNVARPASVTTLRQFGFNPDEATEHIGKFNENLQRRAAIPAGQPGYLTKEDIRELGNAIGGGGAIGGRYGVALINAGRTGRAGEVNEGLAKAGPSAEQDLSHKLRQFDEQLKAIGLTFERVGSEIGAGGITKGVEDLLGAIHLLALGTEVAAGPVANLGHIVGAIPRPVQDAAFALAGIATVSHFANKGIGLEAANKVGLGGFLETEPKKALQQLQRTQSELLAIQEQETARASATHLIAGKDLRRTVNEQAQFKVSPEGQELLNAPKGLSATNSPEGQRLRALQVQAVAYETEVQAAQERYNKTERALLNGRAEEDQIKKTKADLADKSLPVQQRLLKAEQDGLVAVTGGKPGTPLQGARGLVGTGAQIAGEEAAAGIRTGGEAVATSLGAVAGGAERGAIELKSGFALASEQIAAGGAEVATSFRLFAAGNVALADATLVGGVGGLARGALTGLGTGVGALTSGVKANLFKGAITAYIGSLAAEQIGSAIGGTSGKVFGNIGSTTAVGAGLGTLFGPEGTVIGGIGGAAYGAVKQYSAGSDESISQLTSRINKEAERAKKGQKAISEGAAPAAVQLESASEGFGEELEKAFKDESEGAKKALGIIERHTKHVASNLKLFGRSEQGQKASAEAQSDLQKEYEQLAKNPSTTDIALPNIEKETATLNAQSKTQFDRATKGATTPEAIQEALAKARGENQHTYQAIPNAEKTFQDSLAGAREGAKTTRERLKQLESGPQGDATKVNEAKLRTALAAYEKEAASFTRAIKAFHAAVPGFTQATNELGETQASEAYAKTLSVAAPNDARKLAEAGSNTPAKQKVEREIRERNSKTATETFKGGRPGELAELKKVREEAATGAVNERIAKEASGLEKLEREGARRIANLPAGTPKSAADTIRAQTEQARVLYIKRHLNATGGAKALEDAETKLAEVRKVREETLASEAKELISLGGQITQARDQGNAVAQAQDAASTAGQLLAVAKTAPERLQAQLALVQAANQLQQAQQTHIAEIGALAESTEINPLAKAGTKIRTDRAQLARAKGPDERNKLQAQLNNDLTAYGQAARSETEEQISFELKIHNITTGQAVEKLQRLLAQKGKSRADNRKLAGEIYAYQNETAADFGVGNIKSPNLFDARTLTAHARGGIPPAINFTQLHSPPQLHQTNHIAINVAGGHPGEVVRELERAFRVTTKSQLRSAGLT